MCKVFSLKCIRLLFLWRGIEALLPIARQVPGRCEASARKFLFILVAKAAMRSNMTLCCPCPGQVLGRVEAGETALLQREREEANRIRRMSVLLDTRLIALDPLIALFHDF